MFWPAALITELAERRCIIFFGAGASIPCVSKSGSKRMPSWSSLLSSLADNIPDDDDKSFANELIRTSDFLNAAEVIHTKITPADYDRYFTQEFIVPRFDASDMHKSILNIDPKVVVTTNFDTIYEDFCRTGDAANAYSTINFYEDGMVNALRSTRRLIVKAHGSVTNTHRMVLTKSQYFRARKDFPNFYTLLGSIFITSTILFLGYSLNDPDIQLVLENNNISMPSDHKHYFVVEAGMNAALKAAMSRSYNIELIEFEHGRFDLLNTGTEELSKLVLSERQTLGIP